MAFLNTETDYLKLVLNRIPVLDVRAPIEFMDGSIPNSFNCAILNDQERHQIGTCYKQVGRDAAITLGHQIVSGKNRERKLQTWIEFFKNHPQAIVTCFRGGLRSQTAQTWLHESGIECVRLKSGYKGYRQWVLEQYQQLSESKDFRFKVVSGTTGSGKTSVLESLVQNLPVLDLEGLANHRGSAFGGRGEQPSQSDFENQVLSNILSKLYAANGERNSTNYIIVEDESRLIGKRALPPGIFDRIRSSSIILVEENLHSRAQHIFETYVLNSGEISAVLEKYRTNTQNISKKLGLERANEIIRDIELCKSAMHGAEFGKLCLVWIEKLLVWYYDPMYLGSLEKRAPKIDFRGTRSEVKDYLLSCRSN